jgi:hypothetical protein
LHVFKSGDNVVVVTPILTARQESVQIGRSKRSLWILRRYAYLGVDKTPLEAYVVLLPAECDLEREGVDEVEDAVAGADLSGDERTARIGTSTRLT